MNDGGNQQVARRFFVRCWEQLINLYRQVINFFCLSDDSTDGICTAKRQWQGFFGYIRKKFSRRSTRERKVYPRLELPAIDLEFEYKMNHRHRGLALIFNHEYFVRQDKSKRTGTDKDRDRLSDALKELNFHVRSFDDFSFNNMMQELKKVSQMNHRDNDCLLITIMTHGDYGTISSFDADYTLNRITSHFTDENCPSLSGKPRIIFVQACRGNLLDPGHVTTIRSDFVYKLERQSKKYIDQIDVEPFAVKQPEEIYTDLPDEEDMVHNPPNHKDFLIVRSTMPKYLSFRNTDNGSWFIQDLCQEIEKHGTTYDILTLLTHVNWSVSERESRGGVINKKKQILCISTMLTKILIFRDKKV